MTFGPRSQRHPRCRPTCVMHRERTPCNFGRGATSEHGKKTIEQSDLLTPWNFSRGANKRPKKQAPDIAQIPGKIFQPGRTEMPMRNGRFLGAPRPKFSVRRFQTFFLSTCLTSGPRSQRHPRCRPTCVMHRERSPCNFSRGAAFEHGKETGEQSDLLTPWNYSRGPQKWPNASKEKNNRIS